MLRLLGVVTAVICASCAVQQQVPMDVGSTFGVASDGPSGTRATGRVGAQKPAVPATAPDSLPTSLINSLPLLTDESGNQHRSELVLLSFRSGTPQPARHAAITRVGGVVIGGKAGIQMEGWYLIRVASATSMTAIDSVVAKLRANPSVELAGPFTLGFPDDESRQSAVPATAPDSVPFSAVSRVFYPADGGWPYAQDVLMLRFRLGTPVRERSRVIGLVSGTVIGGKRDVTAEGGVYVIGLPRDTSQATLLAARDALRRENAVLTVWLYYFVEWVSAPLQRSERARRP